MTPQHGDRPSAQPGRAERLAAVLERDGPTCAWCGRAFDVRVAPTTDHLVPKVKGGPSWLENEVGACRRCNDLPAPGGPRGVVPPLQHGHRGAVDWLEECERRGWSPDAARVRRVLESLAAAITLRGGQRRARPHLGTQLRRLRRWDG